MRESGIRACRSVAGEATPKGRSRISLVTLVAANLIPLFGVVFLGWDLGLIMVLYWTENVVVGLYNIPRIAFAENLTPEESLGRFFLIPFFCLHYGFFCLVHGLFVLGLFGHEGMLSMTENGASEWFSALLGNLWIPVGAIFISHGVSFWVNYLKGGEYRQAKLSELMARPYRRIFALHVAIIVGGFGIGMLESRIPALAVLIVAKTMADAALHNRPRGVGPEERRLRRTNGPPQPHE